MSPISSSSNQINNCSHDNKQTIFWFKELRQSFTYNNQNQSLIESQTWLWHNVPFLFTCVSSSLPLKEKTHPAVLSIFPARHFLFRSHEILFLFQTQRLKHWKLYWKQQKKWNYCVIINHVRYILLLLPSVKLEM